MQCFLSKDVAGAEADGGASCVAGPEEVCAKVGSPPHPAHILPSGISSGLLQLSASEEIQKVWHCSSLQQGLVKVMPGNLSHVIE